MSGEPKFHRANKNALGNWVAQTLLIKPALKRAFGGVYVRIDPAALRLRRSARYPVIFCMTHSGWFDGHIAFVLNDRVFHYDGYMMMEEVNLARYFFFTWMGVFGVDRDNVRSALASIDYICGILRNGENKALFVFPQGTMRHPDLRPLKLYGGVAAIARKLGRCALVPVAIRYDFIMEQAPDVFLRVGAPILIDAEKVTYNSKELTNLLAESLTSLADRLHADVSAYDRQPYRRLISGRGSINSMWDRTLHLLGRARGLILL
jgi:chlorobactene lauroyltransferase